MSSITVDHNLSSNGMTEEQAYDQGFSDGYSLDEPGFRGEWSLFDSYHRGYEEGAKERAEDEEN